MWTPDFVFIQFEPVTTFHFVCSLSEFWGAVRTRPRRAIRRYAARRLANRGFQPIPFARARAGLPAATATPGGSAGAGRAACALVRSFPTAAGSTKGEDL